MIPWSETQMYQQVLPFRIKKKKKKRSVVTQLGVCQVLEEMITLEEQQHLGQHICFCFHLELLKQCLQNMRLVPLVMGNISVVLSNYLTKQKSESCDKRCPFPFLISFSTALLRYN